MERAEEPCGFQQMHAVGLRVHLFLSQFCVCVCLCLFVCLFVCVRLFVSFVSCHLSHEK